MPGRSRGRCSQTARLLGVIERLRSSHFPVRIVALADEQGVCKRQMERDLLALEDAGCILEHTLVDDDVDGMPTLRSAVRLADKRYAEPLPVARFRDPCGGKPCPGDLHVVVDVSADRVADVLARVLHPTQEAERLPGGGVRLRWRLCELTDVVPWVLWLGSHARAVAPAELVERVAGELNRAAALYAKEVETGTR